MQDTTPNLDDPVSLSCLMSRSATREDTTSAANSNAIIFHGMTAVFSLEECTVCISLIRCRYLEELRLPNASGSVMLLILAVVLPKPHDYSGTFQGGYNSRLCGLKEDS